MAVATMPFNPDVLELFRLAYPSMAGTEVESAELPYPVRLTRPEEKLKQHGGGHVVCITPGSR